MGASRGSRSGSGSSGSGRAWQGGSGRAMVAEKPMSSNTTRCPHTCNIQRTFSSSCRSGLLALPVRPMMQLCTAGVSGSPCCSVCCAAWNHMQHGNPAATCSGFCTSVFAVHMPCTSPTAHASRLKMVPAKVTKAAAPAAYVVLAQEHLIVLLALRASYPVMLYAGHRHTR